VNLIYLLDIKGHIRFHYEKLIVVFCIMRKSLHYSGRSRLYVCVCNRKNGAPKCRIRNCFLRLHTKHYNKLWFTNAV